MRRNNGDNPGTIPSPYGGGLTVPGYTDGTPQGFPGPAPNASEVEARSLNDLQENVKIACVEGTGLPGPAPADPSDDPFELARAMNSSISAVTGPTSYVRSGLTFDTDPGDFIADHLPGVMVVNGRKFHATAERLAAVEVTIGGAPAGTGVQFTLTATRDHYVYLGIQVGSEFAPNVVIIDVPVGDPVGLVPPGTFLTARIRTGVAGTTEVLYYNHGARASSVGEPAGDGLVGLGGDDGSGLRGIAGANGASGEAGVVGQGTGATPGVRGVGGGTGGAGVRGEATVTTAPGVRGVAAAGATTAASGVRGEGQDDAAGVHGIGIDGYGVVAESDLTVPARAALRVVPQDDPPGTVQNGDVYIDSGIGELRVWSGSWRTAVRRANGSTHKLQVEQSATNNNAAAYTSIASVTIDGDDSPQRGGVVYVKFGGELGPNGADLTPNYDLQIFDVTAAASVWQRTVNHPAPSAATADRSFTNTVFYTLPAVGDRTFRFEFRRTGAGATGVQIVDAWIEVIGVF